MYIFMYIEKLFSLYLNLLSVFFGDYFEYWRCSLFFLLLIIYFGQYILWHSLVVQSNIEKNDFSIPPPTHTHSHQVVSADVFTVRIYKTKGK